MQAVYTRLGIVLTYTVMRMRDDVDAKRRRAREVDVCAVESDKVGTSTPNGDVHASSTSVQWRVTKSERRRHWHVDVTTQMSTYSACTDVDVRTRGRRLCADEFCYKRLAIRAHLVPRRRARAQAQNMPAA